MNSRSILLFCAVLGTLAPCCAQNASPALKARLRAQIINIAPQLTGNGNNPLKDDELALPMAQLGDAATASRLASTQLARDGIAQWRVEQRAMRGDWQGAAQQAASVRNGAVRADSFLVIARLATDESDFSAARTALLNAMNALHKAPDAEQFAYAGWLWWRVGDVAAARRVFINKAWPVAVSEDRRANEQLPGRFSHDKQDGVLRFVGRCGLLRELAQSIASLNEFPTEMLVLGIAQTPDDAQYFAERALAKPNLSQAEIYLLALQLAQNGQKEKAHALRARAESITSTSPQPTDKTPESRLYPIYYQLMLAAELNDSATLSALAESWPEQIRGVRGTEGMELLPQIARVFKMANSSGSAFQMRREVARADVDDLTAKLLKNPTLKDARLWTQLIEYYASRDTKQMEILVETVVAQLAAKTAQMETQKKQGSYSWVWDFEASKTAVQLRDSGHVAAARTIVDALLRYTPSEFRQAQAQQFTRTGFDAPARQMFDPLANLQRQLKTNPFLDYGWAGYAEAEARYRAADAPALWFGTLKKPEQRAEVLSGWINGLVPQLKIAAPYVRASINAGKGAEISISRTDAEA